VVLSRGTCLFIAASPGQRAYYDASRSGGLFTLSLVEGLSGKAANSQGDVTPTSLSDFIQMSVPNRAIRLLNKEQNPYYSFDGCRTHDPLFIDETRALVVSVSAHEDVSISNLPVKQDVMRIVAALRLRGVDAKNIITLTDNQATRANILSSIGRLVEEAWQGSDVVLYFNGHGFTQGTQAFLITYDTRISEQTLATTTALNVQDVKARLAGASSTRQLLFLDVSSDNPFSSGR
jgi:hypothetical protein